MDKVSYSMMQECQERFSSLDYCTASQTRHTPANPILDRSRSLDYVSGLLCGVYDVDLHAVIGTFRWGPAFNLIRIDT